MRAHNSAQKLTNDQIRPSWLFCKFCAPIGPLAKVKGNQQRDEITFSQEDDSRKNISWLLTTFMFIFIT